MLKFNILKTIRIYFLKLKFGYKKLLKAQILDITELNMDDLVKAADLEIIQNNFIYKDFKAT